MSHKSVSVMKVATALFDRVGDVLLAKQRPDRLVAGSKPLRHRNQVGHDIFLLIGHHRPGSAATTHDLVENQVDAVVIADFANSREVAWHRRDSTGSRANDRFRDKPRNVLRAQIDNHRLKFVGDPLAIVCPAFVGPAIAILKAGRYMVSGNEQWPKGLAAPLVAADGQCTKRIAVITLFARDKQVSVRFTRLKKILSREFQCRFDGLRAT